MGRPKKVIDYKTVEKLAMIQCTQEEIAGFLDLSVDTLQRDKKFKRAIGNNSKRIDIVLDLFGGSGSTLIACEKLDRRCFMMEIEPEYCQVIIDRWEKYTGQKATKLQ